MMSRISIVVIVTACCLTLSTTTTAFTSVSCHRSTTTTRPFVEATEHLYTHSIDSNGRLFVDGAVNGVEKQAGFIANGATTVMNNSGGRGVSKINGATTSSVLSVNGAVTTKGSSKIINKNGSNSDSSSNGKSSPPMVMTQETTSTLLDANDEQDKIIDQMQKAHESQLAVLQKRIDYFQNSLKTWQQEAHGNSTNSKDVISDLTDQLKETEAALVAERSKTTALSSQVDSLSTELSELQNIFNTQVKDLVEQYEREHQLRRTEQDNAKMRLDQARADAEVKLQQVLDRNIQAIHMAKQRAAEQVEEQEAEMVELRQDLALARTTIQDATVYLMELKEERTSLKRLVQLSWSLVKERVGERVARVRLGRGKKSKSGKSLPRRDA